MRFPPKKIIIIFCCSIFLACSEDYKEEQNYENSIPQTTKEEKFYKPWSLDAEDQELEKIVDEEKGINIDFQELDLDSNTGLLGRNVKSKRNNKIYVHYLPWFQSKPIDGVWGQHWTMTNKNPDIVGENGKRQIASHYYPKIGPYSTNDVDLQQYHLLLMRLSGVDGVIFDWYGIRDVLDFDLIKKGMDNFLPTLERTKMKFAVMYEDRVVKEQARRLSSLQLQQAKNDVNFIKDKYFNNRNYIEIKGKKMLMIFGPNYINESSDWEQILTPLKKEANVLALWNAREIIGTDVCSGEYAWIDKNHTKTLYGYYNYNANFKDEIIGGVAYPRFNSFYKEGGWKGANEYEFELGGRGEDTFLESFYESERKNTDFIQIATWNDFGEGTMIEPTEEFGFNHLERLQELTQVRFKKEDLRIPYYIYKLKKQFPNDFIVQFLCNRAYCYAMMGRIRRSKFLIGLLFYFYGDEFVS